MLSKSMQPPFLNQHQTCRKLGYNCEQLCQTPWRWRKAAWTASIITQCFIMPWIIWSRKLEKVKLKPKPMENRVLLPAWPTTMQRMACATRHQALTFANTLAERDNILALSAVFFEVKDHAHVLCTCKSALECNVDWQEASLNCKLLFGVSPKECGRYMASIGNEMLEQFEPWYFGVAFAFCFKYCTGMPDLVSFGNVNRGRRIKDAPQVDLQLWSKIKWF